MRNVALFADFWNFALRWNEQMNPDDPNAPRVRLKWVRLPEVLISELPAKFGGVSDFVYRGTLIFASVDPRPGSKDQGLKRFLHYLGQEPGFQVDVRNRKPKQAECPHCKEQIERMVEKGVDASVVTALYEGAINNSYDVALLLSNDTDHVPAIRTIQDRLNKQIVHVGFKRGGSEVRTACWTHILLDGDLAESLTED